MNELSKLVEKICNTLKIIKIRLRTAFLVIKLLRTSNFFSNVAKFNSSRTITLGTFDIYRIFI